jgi:hypothetical protein
VQPHWTTTSPVALSPRMQPAALDVAQDLASASSLVRCHIDSQAQGTREAARCHDDASRAQRGHVGVGNERCAGRRAGRRRGNREETSLGARQKPPANGPACSGLGAGVSSKPPELEVAVCHCQWKAAGPPRKGPLPGGRPGPRLARPQGSARASLGPPGCHGAAPARPAEAASESPASGGSGSESRSRSARRGRSGHWGQATH